ncbi:TIGR04219 family outer membrane beta-barrel protein [Marinobacteraceae bacterium S3BR75-40.1]
MNRLGRLLSITPLVLMATPALSDVFGAAASATYWHSSNSGSIEKGNSGAVDLEDDLNFKDEDFSVITVAFEHPVPALPNLRFQYFNMDQAGSGNLPNDFGNAQAGYVNTNLDLSNYDLTFYYEILDNWVNVDAGVTGKLFNGELTLRDSNGNVDETKIDTLMPLLYAQARFDVPGTALSLGAGGNYLSYDGDEVYDLAAYANYRIVVLDIRAGYREMRVDVDDVEDVDVNATISGPYLELGVSF